MKHANLSTTTMWWTVFAVLIASFIFVFADPCRSAAIEELGTVGVLVICELFRRYAHQAKEMTPPLLAPTKLTTEEDEQLKADEKKLIVLLERDHESSTDAESTVGDLSSACSISDSDSELDILEWHKVGLRMAHSACSSSDSENEAEPEELDIPEWRKVGVCMLHSLHKAITDCSDDESEAESFHADDWYAVGGRLADLLRSIEDAPDSCSDAD